MTKPDDVLQEIANTLSQEERPGANIRSIMNVHMPVKVILGTSRLSVNQLLALSNGSVIELDRRIGEPFDVMIGDRLVARGEVVRVNESGGLGIKLTEITQDYMPKAV